ncbi:Uncharacterized protein QTN25_003079 [Entamoeba marina]
MAQLSLADDVRALFENDSIKPSRKAELFTIEFFRPDSLSDILQKYSVNHQIQLNHQLTHTESSTIKSQIKQSLKLPKTLNTQYIESITKTIQTDLAKSPHLNKNGESKFQPGQKVTVVHEDCIRKGKVVVPYPMKMDYGILLEPSFWFKSEGCLQQFKWYKIRSGEYDDKLLSPFTHLKKSRYQKEYPSTIFTQLLPIVSTEDYIYQKPLISLKKKEITKPSVHSNKQIKVSASKHAVHKDSELLAKKLSTFLNDIALKISKGDCFDADDEEKFNEIIPEEINTYKSKKVIMFTKIK